MEEERRNTTYRKGKGEKTIDLGSAFAKKYILPDRHHIRNYMELYI